MGEKQNIENLEGVAGFDYKFTPQMMEDLPRAAFNGPIWLIKTPEHAEEVGRHLKRCRLIGFDTEARPSFTKGVVYPVSLLQISTYREAYIFQLQSTGLPDSIVEVLSNPKILKTGVAVKGDLSDLQKLRRFKPAGFIELSDFSKKNKMKNHGLQGIAAALLNLKISKKEQCSNWAAKKLTESQLQYAATDAWIGREIYLNMKKRGWL